MAAAMATSCIILFLGFLLLAVVALEENVRGSDSLVHQVEQKQPEKEIEIVATYTDASGALRTHKVKSSDLSPSWVIEKYGKKHVEIKSGLDYQVLNESTLGGEDHNKSELSGKEDCNKSALGGKEDCNTSALGGEEYRNQLPTDKKGSSITPVKLERQRLREERRQTRTSELLQADEDSDLKMQLAAVQRTKGFGINTKKRGHKSTLDSMRDQIILLRIYASIASSINLHEYSVELSDLVSKSLALIGQANSDAELKKGALVQEQKMGRELFKAKGKLYDCETVSRKLRAMAQSVEEVVMALKKKNLFLMQVASFTIPKSLHCLHLQLTKDYLSSFSAIPKSPSKYITENRSLYHYAIFSDNILSTSVVVNSAISNAKEPEKHVFHIVTDRLNYASMEMWFSFHSSEATVEVKSMDDFKWLNSSYCSVLRQLESAKMKEFYFKSNHPAHLAALNEHLSYKNPKYLSMLNHIRFYMPELFPKLNKILFLDDDVVVQKDLTALWSMDMKGMVNAAVETCKGRKHLYQQYLNFSNPKISENFDPKTCGWAFGMNFFDLKLWRKNNLTGEYHYWQDMNEERLLWKLGTLPPGLLTFYKRTYILDKSWHLLALGYDPSIKASDIENAAVIHYNGNYKPWMDTTEAKYRKYWSKYLSQDDPYFRFCKIYPFMSSLET